MDGALVDCHCRFFYGFVQRRVPVDDVNQVIVGATKLHDDGDFVDQRTGVLAQDMRTEDAAVFLVGEDFDGRLLCLLPVDALVHQYREN